MARELLSGAVGEFAGVIAGGENVMEQNGQRVPERALQAGQGNGCPAELLLRLSRNESRAFGDVPFMSLGEMMRGCFRLTR